MSDLISLFISVLVIVMLVYCLYLTNDCKKILNKMMKRNKKYQKDIEKSIKANNDTNPNKPNPWEQDIIDNADSYSVVEWRPLNKTTKTVVKTYQEAKELFDKTIVEHTATLVYAIKNNSHANLNHLDDFSRKVKYVKSKTR